MMDTSNVSNALDVEVLNAVLRSRRHKRRVILLYLSGLRARIAHDRAG